MPRQFRYVGIKKAIARRARCLERATVSAKAQALERELEPVGHLARPFAKGCRRLGAVKGAIDLDRGEPLGGVSELLRMRQAFGIKQPAPGLERPAADADIDWPRFHGHLPVIDAC